ncbi:acyltransferase family protein [Pantoea septica]|uniref:acyltransferase family protein n=1 Tax=Pantoea septica TaxID=472695 RepID=UPI001C0FD7D1|nr:acyltransferase [Pantoea septica]MBU5376253.1 acyltransferase [Pantoea septica]
MDKFRSDINGLRAIAVLGVVLFHYKPDWLPGGFAGVDVFFVISGFLMTGIIIEKLSKNNFSFFDFYLKRALRIIPALSLLCISLIVIGFFVLDPASYQVLAKDAISTVLFISNYIYFFNSGYFDQSSQERFLLHSWSLSVEWQFYLLLPLLMVFLYKKIRNDLFVYLFSFLVVTLLLLELGLWLYKPDFIYYDFISRSWELLLGGLIYFIPKIRTSLLRNVAFYSGFFSIVFSFFYFDSSFAWPGYYALLPVAGAGLIIFSKKHSFLLDNVIFQKIGSTSYSLYLVHWPLIVLYKKLNIELTWLNYLFLCCALTFLLNFFGEKKRGSFKKKCSCLSFSFVCCSQYSSFRNAFKA